MIRVMIERHCSHGQEGRLEGLLLEIRREAMLQPGYISGETLQSAEDPTHWIVISTWIQEDQWAEWLKNSRRLELMSKIEPLLSSPEKVEIYHFTRSGVSSSAHTLDS